MRHHHRETTGVFHAVRHKPAADVIKEERDRVQVVVQLCVVIEAAVPLQLHRLPQQGLQAPRGQHHRGRQVRCKDTQAHGGRGGDKFDLCCNALLFSAPRPLSLQGHCANTSAHFVVCPAVCSGRRCPCPPTQPWLSDPQHGCTSSTCGRHECRS